MQKLNAYGYAAYQQLSKTMARVGNGAEERGGDATVVVPARRALARGDLESAG